jgi:tetratricopeptide (TPR) repeat protein
MLWNASDLGFAGFANPSLLDLARKAAVLRPDVVKNWELLAWLLLRDRRDDEAIKALREGLSRLPQEPRLHLILADAYGRTGRLDAMGEVLDRVPPIPAEDRQTTIYQLSLQMQRRDGKDGAKLAAAALALDPTHEGALKVLGHASRENGTPEIMVPICQTALKRVPWHTRARFELAFAYAMLGDSEHARKLIDLEQFVTVTELETPENYVNAGAFEAALASEITRNPTLEADPIGKATRGGFQTKDNLPHTGDLAIGIALSRIRLAVDAFEANLPKGQEDAFVTKRPERAMLNAWAVIYPGDGRQSWHIHPDGWLSGTYYVSTPRPSREDSFEGCLVLGTLGEMVDPPWGTRSIRPVPGRLVMFPSFVPHATVPTNSTDSRICISFDVCRC